MAVLKAPTELPLALISCEKYHALIRLGAFAEDKRLKLLNGYLIQKVSIGPNHAGAVKALNFLHSRRLGDPAIVAVQGPVTTLRRRLHPRGMAGQPRHAADYRLHPPRRRRLHPVTPLQIRRQPHHAPLPGCDLEGG